MFLTHMLSKTRAAYENALGTLSRWAFFIPVKQNPPLWAEKTPAFQMENGTQGLVPGKDAGKINAKRRLYIIRPIRTPAMHSAAPHKTYNAGRRKRRSREDAPI